MNCKKINDNKLLLKNTRVSDRAIAPFVLSLIGFAIGISAFMSNEEGFALIAFGAFGVFLSLAIILFSISYYLVFDGQENHMVTFWKFFKWRLSPQKIDFNWFDKLCLTKEEVFMGRTYHTFYRVRLVGKDKEQWNILCEESPSYKEANKLAEQISEVMQKNIHDFTTEEEIVREVKYLHESLVERWKRTGELGEVPPLPEQSRVNVEEDKHHVRIVLPREGWDLANTLAAMFLFAFFAGLAFLFALPLPHDVRFVVVIIFALMFLGNLYSFFYNSFKKNIITVFPSSLCLEECFLWKKNRRELDLNDICKVTYDRKNSPTKVLVRGLNQNAEIQHHLTLEELLWLSAFLENAIAKSSELR